MILHLVAYVQTGNCPLTRCIAALHLVGFLSFGGDCEPFKRVTACVVSTCLTSLLDFLVFGGGHQIPVRGLGPVLCIHVAYRLK